jgi:lysophospholipase L1-like esterase
MLAIRRTIPAIVLGGLLSVTHAAAVSWAPPAKQANAGDSISQGFGANSWPGDHPDLSWVQGSDERVHSTASRYAATMTGFTQGPESVSGAELVGGNDNFAAQASRICAQSPKPVRVRVLLGGNDVCNRPRSDGDDAAANLYSVETMKNALRAGLDQLAACLPPRSVVQVLSVPRVDGLYEAGHAKSSWCYNGVWPMANVCRVVTAEDDAGRRAQIGARIDEYNVAIAAEVKAYDGKNDIGFVSDWSGTTPNTSVGTFRFTKDDINGVDCFHPNIDGQARIACVAWAKSPDGTGPASACFTR